MAEPVRRKCRANSGNILTGRWAIAIGDVVELVTGSPDMLVVDVDVTGLGVRNAVVAWRCPESGKIYEAPSKPEFLFRCRKRANSA